MTRKSSPAHIADVVADFVSDRFGRQLRYVKDVVGVGCEECVDLYADLYAHHDAGSETEAEIHTKIARQLFDLGADATPNAEHAAFVDAMKDAAAVMEAVCDAWNGVSVPADANRSMKRRKMMRRS